MVKVIAVPRDPAGASLPEYISGTDLLSRQVLDAAMIASYEASLAVYDSKVAEKPG